MVRLLSRLQRDKARACGSRNEEVATLVAVAEAGTTSTLTLAIAGRSPIGPEAMLKGCPRRI